jgi:hypothetical protein
MPLPPVKPGSSQGSPPAPRQEPPAPPAAPPPSAFGKGEKLEPPAKAKKPNTHENRN